MKQAVIKKTKKFAVLAILVLALGTTMSTGLASTVSAGPSGDNSGIPDGCPGSPHAGVNPPSTCPKLVRFQSDLKCDASQTATKATNGKWYCKDKPAPASPSGGGSANASGIGSGTGCVGGGSTCGHQCGAADQDPYTPAIDIGCRGKGNPIMDALFGIIRFLSDGVGLVVIGSIIVGGIQYSASRGDPQSTAMAINRIRSSLYALLIYIFAYAMLNYLIPGAVLQ